MKKRFLAVMLSLTLALSLFGCGEKKPVEDTNSTASTESVETETKPEETGTEQPETPKDAAELYTAFLDGTGKVYGDRIKDTFYNYETDQEELYFPDQNGYTFRELSKRIIGLLRQDISSCSIGSVNYAYVDFAMDGQKELLIQYGFEGADWGGPESMELILGVKDGKLEILYSMISYTYEYATVLNNQGVIIQGYNDYGQSVFESGTLDADGNYKLFYYYESNNIDSYANSEDPLVNAGRKLMEENEDDMLFEGVTIESYGFTKPGESRTEEFYKNLLRIPYYYYVDYSKDEIEEITEMDDETRGFVEKAFENSGTKWYTQEEIDALLLEHFKELGYDETAMEYSDVEFMDVESTVWWPGKTVTVNNVEEFFGAIENDSVIYLAPGVYNLSDWAKDSKNLAKMEHYEYENGNNPGVLYSGADEIEFYIYGINNLSIQSLDVNNPATIVIEPRYSTVLNFADCSGISVKYIVAGHTPEQGVCSGDVLGFERCERIGVVGCDLYGCGAYGLRFWDCYSAEVDASVIHDCSYGCVEASSGGWISFENTTFENCREYTMFELMDTSAYFYNCTFRNLEGEMLRLTEGSYVSFMGCTMDDSVRERLENSGYGDRVVLQFSEE